MNPTGAPLGVAERQQRLRWRCRRGMKELDLLLGRWLEACYAGASAAEQGVFAEFLELPDPQIAGYLLGSEAPEQRFASLVAQLRDRQALCTTRR